MAKPESDLAWFGPNWGSLGNQLWPQIEIPADPCDNCGQYFGTNRCQGIAALYGSAPEYYHRKCWAPGPYLLWDDHDEFGPAE